MKKNMPATIVDTTESTTTKTLATSDTTKTVLKAGEALHLPKDVDVDGFHVIIIFCKTTNM